jgi:glutamine amidotransferase
VAPEQGAVVAGETVHGLSFASAVWKGSLFACQFHPEKSGAVGLRMLENFGRLAGSA